MDAGEFEIFIEVDGVPLLNYPDAEGTNAYVCSAENKAYLPWVVNHTTEALSVKYSIDSKAQPGSKTAFPSQPRRLRTAVCGDDGEEVYAEFRFAGNPPPSAQADAVIPAENLDRFGRIDVSVYGSIFIGSRLPRERHLPRQLSEIKPQEAEIPLAKRKVGACTTSVSTGSVKVARHGSSGYALDADRRLGTFTLHYRPARILRYYGLQGIQPEGVDWAGWLRSSQFPRVASLRVPLNPLLAPRVRTPVAWVEPQVRADQVAIRTTHWASKAALELYAAQNGLSLERHVENLEDALALALWGDTAAPLSEAVGHCIRCQRQGQTRHYNALVAHGWAEDAVQLKAFSDFFQVPVALHAPGSEPAVQVLISPLMKKPHTCYALGLLKDEWVLLQAKGEEEPKPVVVIEID